MTSDELQTDATSCTGRLFYRSALVFSVNILILSSKFVCFFFNSENLDKRFRKFRFFTIFYQGDFSSLILLSIVTLKYFIEILKKKIVIFDNSFNGICVQILNFRVAILSLRFTLDQLYAK